MSSTTAPTNDNSLADTSPSDISPSSIGTSTKIDDSSTSAAPASTTTSATTNPTTTASETDSNPLASVDPLSALSSMWTGWLSPSTSSAATTSTSTQTQPTNPTQSASNASNDGNVATATDTANDLLQGAGKMWNDFGNTLKDAAVGTVASVDTSAINQSVDVFRQQSNKIMEDVSRSVQESLNISLPSTQDIDISASAQAITTQTKQFIDKATSTIEQSRKEALEIFVDDDDNINNNNSNNEQQNNEQNSIENTLNNEKQNNSLQKAYAPWDVESLPENEKKYSDILRREMLKLVVDAIYSKKKRNWLFLSDVAKKRGFNQFDVDTRLNEAMAALDADKNMRRLRAGLVPGKMKEETFWTTYFYHVQRIRQTLLANDGVMPENSGIEEEDDDDDDLFGDNDQSNHETDSNNKIDNIDGSTLDTNNNGNQSNNNHDDTTKATTASTETTATTTNTTTTTNDDSIKDSIKINDSESRDWDKELDAAFDDDE